MTAKEYNRLNELLAEYSLVSAAIERDEAEIKTAQLQAGTELIPQHAERKVKLTSIEAELRALSDACYADLFPGDPGDEKRTHKTPFGELAYHKSTSLEFDDAEKTLLKVKVACHVEEARAKTAGVTPRFTAAQLIRTREEINLDAMKSLDPVTLALFDVRREQHDNFKVKPFTMKSDRPAKVAKKKEAA